MALWGNKDSKTASGTVSIANTGVVTGSGTSFTTQAKVGNTLTAGGVDYQIISISSNTSAKVIMGTNNGNGTVTTASGASYALSEKPAFVAHESANSSGGTGDSTKVFGVDGTEAEYGGEVIDISVSNGGAYYAEAPAVTVAAPTSGTTATATATISGGKVTAITITGRGDGYTTTPAVTIQVPVLTVPAASVTLATDVIGYTAHGLSTGDAVVYNNGGGTAATGLTSGTTYYIIKVNANSFKVATHNTSLSLLALVQLQLLNYLQVLAVHQPLLTLVGFAVLLVLVVVLVVFSMKL